MRGLRRSDELSWKLTACWSSAAGGKGDSNFSRLSILRVDVDVSSIEIVSVEG